MKTEEVEVGKYIPLHYHFQMLTDEARVESFAQAIELSLPAGGKALDLGGGTGILSYFASRKASRVWCVERLPGMAARAREFLALNGAAGKVDVVQDDATKYLPPEPVDTVICEMLHSGLLRENQVAVIRSFRERYTAKYGQELPDFVPEATILGVQPLCYDFVFSGYQAPLPVFEDPGSPSERAIPLGDPKMYCIVQYSGALPSEISMVDDLKISREGKCNAFRFITTNVLELMLKGNKAITWMNQNLILPLKKPLDVKAGNSLRTRFRYQPGDEIDVLWSSIEVSPSS